MAVIVDAGSAGTVFALAAAVQVTLESAVVKGDLIGFGTTGWVKADADLAAGPIEPELIALQSGAALAIIKASRMAQISGRYTLGTLGAPLYASGTAGRVTETLPATVGDFRGKVGKVMYAGTGVIESIVMLEVPVAMPVHRFFVTKAILAAEVDTHIFTAVRPCIVRAISYIPRVIGSDGGAVTLALMKIDAVEAPSAATIMHSGTANLKGTADTVQNLTLAAIAALTLAAGNGLAIDVTGTLTAVVGVLTVELEYVE